MIERIRVRGLLDDDTGTTMAKYCGQLSEKAAKIRIGLRNAADDETRQRLQADLYTLTEALRLARAGRKKTV
jgi:hypothetical protein